MITVLKRTAAALRFVTLVAAAAGQLIHVQEALADNGQVPDTTVAHIAGGTATNGAPPPVTVLHSIAGAPIEDHYKGHWIEERPFVREP